MSILIGKHIKNILESNRDIKMAVGNRIYPVAITQSTPAYPLVVYQSSGTTPDYTKDGSCEDTVSVDMVLLHQDYSQGLALLQQIRYALEDVTVEYDDFIVVSSTLANTAEDYDDNIAKYVFGITFNFNTIDK